MADSERIYDSPSMRAALNLYTPNIEPSDNSDASSCSELPDDVIRILLKNNCNSVHTDAANNKKKKGARRMRNPLKEKELFETTPVFQAILSLALPSVIGQIILVLYNMADTFFIGMTKNDAMITAVAVCMPAFMFLSAISNLFGIGAASVIARSLGTQDRNRAKNASSFAIWGCLAVSVLYSFFCFLFSDLFVDLLGGSSESVHDLAHSYLSVCVVIGGPVTAMNTLFSHLVRSEGHSLQASVGIALGGVLNIALDPLFMFVILPKGQEALGAAIATSLSNGIAFLYYLFVIRKYRSNLVLSARFSHDIFMNHIPRDVIAVGIPACLMTLCENISFAILDNLMVASGVQAQAGIGVAKKVNMLAHSIVRGMTQGVLPLIGYNYSSGNRVRMKKSVYLSGAASIVISCVCMMASLLFSKPLVSIFIQSTSASLDFGSDFLRILCLGAPFSACAYTVISFFQATGHGRKSLILALLRKGILDIPLMFILRFIDKTYSIVWATPIADIVCCICSVILFSAFLRRRVCGGPVKAPVC